MKPSSLPDASVQARLMVLVVVAVTRQPGRRRGRRAAGGGRRSEGADHGGLERAGAGEGLHAQLPGAGGRTGDAEGLEPAGRAAVVVARLEHAAAHRDHGARRVDEVGVDVGRPLIAEPAVVADGQHAGGAAVGGAQRDTERLAGGAHREREVDRRAGRRPCRSAAAGRARRAFPAGCRPRAARKDRASTSPAPQSLSGPAGPASWAEDRSACLTCAGVAVGAASRPSATTPATNGVAIEVPGHADVAGRRPGLRPTSR